MSYLKIVCKKCEDYIKRSTWKSDGNEIKIGIDEDYERTLKRCDSYLNKLSPSVFNEAARILSHDVLECNAFDCSFLMKSLGNDNNILAVEVSSGEENFCLDINDNESNEVIEEKTLIISNLFNFTSFINTSEEMIKRMKAIFVYWEELDQISKSDI